MVDSRKKRDGSQLEAGMFANDDVQTVDPTIIYQIERKRNGGKIVKTFRYWFICSFTFLIHKPNECFYS